MSKTLLAAAGTLTLIAGLAGTFFALISFLASSSHFEQGDFSNAQAASIATGALAATLAMIPLGIFLSDISELGEIVPDRDHSSRQDPL